tara:strand:- start:25638 stop:27164 length:1527 start_codon:yes stop_codon:yes gene_type:complete
MDAIEPRCIGVVGAGVMGRGIAQLFAQAGHRVLCHDSVAGAATDAVAEVRARWQRSQEKGRLSAAQKNAAGARLAVAEKLADLAECDLVIEAIVERLDAKQALLVDLEGHVRAEALLVSNTSSLMVAAIAARCRHPERVAGLHFFNPAPLMKVVEIVAAVRTAPSAVERLGALVASTGHRAVIAKDQPGFLINHAGRGLYTEGLRLLEEGVADYAAIDRVLREGLGFRMGPFELLDLTGLDVSGQVMQSIYEQFQHEPRFRPSSLVPPRVAAGLYGRKSGEGWYRYHEGKAVRSPAPVPPELTLKGPVWIDPKAEHADLLGERVRAQGLTLGDQPEQAALLIIQPWGDDASTVCARDGLNPERCVAVDPLIGLTGHIALMLTIATSSQARDAAHALLAADGVPVTVIHDSPGFIAQRVLAMIVNIAAEISQRGIASIADIDDAVSVGLGYPHGPLAWGDRLGAGRVLTILERIQKQRGDPRYRPAPWLSRRARLGLPLRHQEAALPGA